MSKCSVCKVEILDDSRVCPLCHRVLGEGDGGTATYPDARILSRKLKLFTNILLFSIIVACAVVGYINYRTYSGIMWSLIVAAGLAYLFLIIRMDILGNQGYKFKIVVTTLAGILYVLLIDYVTGYRGWSVNFVVPAAIMLMDVGVIILMIVNFRNWQSYLLFQIFLILCSLIPLILIALGVVTSPGLSELAFGCSVFLFLGTLIIGDRRARVELKRRFHVR